MGEGLLKLRERFFNQDPKTLNLQRERMIYNDYIRTNMSINQKILIKQTQKQQNTEIFIIIHITNT